MAQYKGGQAMYAKYAAKFNPTVIGTRFTDVKDLALARAQAGLLTVGAIRDLIRPILDKYGVASTARALYLAFGLALYRHTARSSADAAKKIADGLKSYYVTSFDANPDILNEIINVVTGWVSPY
jgi:hypothetical protein